MLPKLRSALRAVARALLRPPAAPAGAIERWRVELLLNAVAQSLRGWSGEGLPPSFAMLEVLVREVAELEVLIEGLDDADGERVLRLLARMREETRQETREGAPHPRFADPLPAGGERGEEAPPSRELHGDEETLVRRARLESMLLTGDSRSERALLDGEYDADTTLWIARSIIDGSLDEENRKRALSLVRLDPFSKARVVRTLAEIAGWGVARGMELTARAFRFQLYGTAAGEIGRTRLHGRVIHFNPLPLLRGETDGRRIVEAIMLHEIGHHRYNAGPEWRAVNRLAAEERLDQLLNLVQDEHLERNLRSIQTEWGDSLKILAAWAFQRSSRTIDLDTLLELLGGAAFRVLVRARLEPARDRTEVTVSSGRLLRALALHGSSFSRFLRALRMGLGNRGGDPKVAEALALFDKDFRNATPERMLDIARELRRIFGDEAGLGDALSLHGAIEADDGELAARLPGVTDGDIADEMESRRESPRPAAEKNDNVATMINRGGGTEFDPIDDVVVLPFHSHEYFALAKGVAGWSRQLRRFFETLGLTRITVRRRTRGSAVDRAALPRAVIGGDPRVLMARRTVLHSDLFLGVLIDCSGSMQREGSMDRAQLFAALIAEAARGLDGIDARFFGFTDEVIYDAGNAAQCAVAQLAPNGGNNDAAALWHASRVALKSKRSARLLVMISDGSPTECSVESLRALVKRLTAERIACAQVAVQPIDDVCFPDYVLVDDKDLSGAVGRFGKITAKLVRKVVR